MIIRSRKVPRITSFFWLIKVLTTGMGEVASDFFVRHGNPYIAVLGGAIGLIVALAVQLALRHYYAWAYWLTVVMVSVFGTMAADVLHIALGVPYLASTSVFTVVLVLLFVVWYQTERTLSIHSVSTIRREVFYWLAILTTFALGTAAGDMTAVTLHLGYFMSGVLFLIIIILPALMFVMTHRYAVLTFWFAYIVTRPLGASFADWIAVSPSRGGLGWGTGLISVVLLVAIVGLVGYLSLTHADVQRDRAL